jgi:hypothetical protein
VAIRLLGSALALDLRALPGDRFAELVAKAVNHTLPSFGARVSGAADPSRPG